MSRPRRRVTSNAARSSMCRGPTCAGTWSSRSPSTPASRSWPSEHIAGARTPYDAARRIQTFLRSAPFRYSLDVPADQSQNALVDFLFNTRAGFCQQFAAAFAVLAREVSLPTRVAVGFTEGYRDAQGVYHVKDADAHAWPEVWFDGIGWVAFEPTPGRGSPDPASQAVTGVQPHQADAPSTPTTTPGATTVAPNSATPPASGRQGGLGSGGHRRAPPSGMVAHAGARHPGPTGRRRPPVGAGPRRHRYRRPIPAAPPGRCTCRAGRPGVVAGTRGPRRRRHPASAVGDARRVRRPGRAGRGVGGRGRGRPGAVGGDRGPGRLQRHRADRRRRGRGGRGRRRGRHRGRRPAEALAGSGATVGPPAGRARRDGRSRRGQVGAGRGDDPAARRHSLAGSSPARSAPAGDGPHPHPRPRCGRRQRAASAGGVSPRA